MESKEQNYGISGEPEAAERQAERQAEREPEQEPVGPYVVGEDHAGQDHAGQDRAGYEPVGEEYVGRESVAMGAREERTWSVLAHLSGFLNIFTLFLGPVAALIVWLVYRDRSPKVAFDALQSAAYQGAWLAILGIGWAVTIGLTFVLIGFLLIPAMLILTVVPFAHMGYAAYKVGKYGEYRYPVVADLIENR
ncbi:MAG TPA: DUF4870 domain-containing protein [Rubrobacter sp.]|nr:DUF4870 domain-containing protein [Rubrobacter sp.]